MARYQRSASALPFHFLAPQKHLETLVFDRGKVFDHGHAVIRAITLIQLLQSFAGKSGAREAELLIARFQVLAVANNAFRAIFKEVVCVAGAS